MPGSDASRSASPGTGPSAITLPFRVQGVGAFSERDNRHVFLVQGRGKSAETGHAAGQDHQQALGELVQGSGVTYPPRSQPPLYRPQ